MCPSVYRRTIERGISRQVWIGNDRHAGYDLDIAMARLDDASRKFGGVCRLLCALL